MGPLIYSQCGLILLSIHFCPTHLEAHFPEHTHRSGVKRRFSLCGTAHSEVCVSGSSKTDGTSAPRFVGSECASFGPLVPVCQGQTAHTFSAGSCRNIKEHDAASLMVPVLHINNSTVLALPVTPHPLRIHRSSAQTAASVATSTSYSLIKKKDDEFLS